MAPGETPESIEGVLDRLDRILDEARRRGDRSGYFAALYRNVTRRVQAGIESGRFEDPDRMERFDVLFARRYLKAFDRHQSGVPVPECWSVSFEADDEASHLILQHLVLGMNAHINFDLPAAALEVNGPDGLPALKRDFFEITSLLTEMLNQVQDAIGDVSPWIWVLDRIGETTDEELFGFALATARDHAWHSAQTLAALPPDRRSRHRQQSDETVAKIGRGVLRPAWFLRPVEALVRAREPDDPARVIRALSDA